MSQVYDPAKPTSGTTTFGQLYQILRDHIAAAISQFSGTAFPASPTAGQKCYRTDRLTAAGYPKCYTYSGNAVLGESGWCEDAVATTLGEEVLAARGTKPTLDQRLDVAHNEDGTLKASTTLNPSQWYLPSLIFTYLSTTSFKVNGDQADIYRQTRRLKVNLAASTAYTEVVSASYSAPDTTIQVLDAVLDATLVDVEHSLFLPDRDGKSAISPRMAGNYKVKTVTADYTTTLNDDTILVDASGGAKTITVLAAATLGAGRRQKVIKIDSSANAVTIDPNGSETVNGNATLAITVPLTGVECESDGTNLRTIDDSTEKLTTSDIVQDFVVSGLLGVDPGASLTMTIPAGTAYVIGRRVVKLAGASDLTRTYTASKDTYVDISHVGAITYTEVANGAGAPSVAANSIRLMKVVTDGTEITGVADLRVLSGGIKDPLGTLRYLSEVAAAGAVALRTSNKDLVDRNDNAMFAIQGEQAATTYTAAANQLNMGNVSVGDIILVHCFSKIYSGTLPTYPYGESGKASGTATVDAWDIFATFVYPLVAIAASVQCAAVSYLIKVTGAGNLWIKNVINQTGGSGNSYVNKIHAVFIRKQ